MRKDFYSCRLIAGPALWALICGLIAFALAVPARAQTPSPLAEWQYSPGLQLQRLFEPTIPTWQTNLGVGVSAQPVFMGSGRYQVQGGPAINIYYKDRIFISTGEGLGVNAINFRHLRLGAAVTYFLGRYQHADGKALTGLGSLHAAPEIKFFGDYTLAKALPLDIRFDARKQLGATFGWIGDVGAYMPMPGSSERFAWFAGPTVTVADTKFMNGYFGVSRTQAASTHYHYYKGYGGFQSVGFGLSASWFVTPHVILNLDGSYSRLLRSAAQSPITDVRDQGIVALSAVYKFQNGF
jgi:outer membrane scaffolding protein for murein synthesis (MipA/OmpV family)